MAQKYYRPIYKARLRIAAALSILEMVGAASSMTDLKLLEKGKPERHAPFRTLVFALTVRCASMLEGVGFHSQAIRASRTLKEAELLEMEAAISAKRKELAAAQRLIEQGSLPSALLRLGKARGGLAALAEKLDEKIEKRLG